MSLILGLDSGGTKTLVAYADESGQVVSLSRGPGLDPSVGPGWRQALEYQLAGNDVPAAGQLAAAVFGLPFHDEVVRYTDEQTAVAESLVPGRALVQNDVRIAFDGALAGQPGVLALAGTGSMAWASLNGPDDPHIRVGGWGDAFGDEGSAFWIGREALTVVSQHLDGRIAAPEFCDGLLSALGLRPDELAGWCYGLDNRRLGMAGLSRLVAGLAAAGNVDAAAILSAAGDHLATHVLAAWRRTRATVPLRWSYAGGVLANVAVLDRIRHQVGTDPVPPRLPPVGGALLRAAHRAGWSIDDAWIDRLSTSLTTGLCNDDQP